MSVEEVNFNRKDELMEVRVTHDNASTSLLTCEYFGKMDGFEGFMAFWGEGKEIPFLILATECIRAIEILEEKDKEEGVES